MIDILGYSFVDFTFMCNLLHSCSNEMRDLLKKHYTVIKNMLFDTHLTFDALLSLSRNYKTSRAAHQRLHQIMKRECEKATIIDYGLEILPDTVLHIANLEGLEMFLQAELKAIKDGCKYIENSPEYKLYKKEG